MILDQAEQKGTGRWTAQDALELGVPLTGDHRGRRSRASLSRAARPARARRRACSPGPKPGAAPRPTSLVDDVAHGAVRLEGRRLRAGLRADGARPPTTYDWDLDLGELATIWRGGCIIRARFLDRITEAYDDEPGPGEPAAGADYFRDAVADAQDAWRQVIVARRSSRASPVPAFSSSLAYYDGYRRERGPANLIQGQRDFFGAHTYRRVDNEGSFHTRWAQDGDEVRTDG